MRDKYAFVTGVFEIRIAACDAGSEEIIALAVLQYKVWLRIRCGRTEVLFEVLHTYTGIYF